MLFEALGYPRETTVISRFSVLGKAWFKVDCSPTEKFAFIGVKIDNNECISLAALCKQLGCEAEWSADGKEVRVKKKEGDYKGNYADFLDALGFKESSDQYNKTSASGTYLGRYQMGPDALKTVGFMDDNENWTDLAKKHGVSSKQSFLNSPAAQEYAIRVYHQWLLGGITSNGIEMLYDTIFLGTVDGTNRKESALLTPSGILASMHLVGRGATIRMLVGDEDVKGIIRVDGYGTTATEYMNSFGGYDLSDLISWETE